MTCASVGGIDLPGVFAAPTDVNRARHPGSYPYTEPMNNCAPEPFHSNLKWLAMWTTRYNWRISASLRFSSVKASSNIIRPRSIPVVPPASSSRMMPFSSTGTYRSSGQF